MEINERDSITLMAESRASFLNASPLARRRRGEIPVREPRGNS